MWSRGSARGDAAAHSWALFCHPQALLCRYTHMNVCILACTIVWMQKWYLQVSVETRVLVESRDRVPRVRHVNLMSHSVFLRFERYLLSRFLHHSCSSVNGSGLRVNTPVMPLIVVSRPARTLVTTA